jgi:isopentenyl-diphosphate Delta-isomerase
MLKRDHLILVNSADEPVGTMEKMEAHQLGLLHRAFSILVFNTKGELLIQQRAAEKYHSAGLWTNTCCSHPLAGSAIEDTIHARLQHEMGFDCELQFLYKFEYRKEFANGLTEHELDYVYVGISDATPHPNPAEASAYRWVSWPDLLHEWDNHPERFTFWLGLILEQAEIHDFVLTLEG